MVLWLTDCADYLDSTVTELWLPSCLLKMVVNGVSISVWWPVVFYILLFSLSVPVVAFAFSYLTLLTCFHSVIPVQNDLTETCNGLNHDFYKLTENGNPVKRCFFMYSFYFSLLPFKLFLALTLV